MESEPRRFLFIRIASTYDLASLYVERSAFRTSLNRRNTPRISSLFFPEKEDFTFLPYLSFLERGALSIWFLFFLHAKKELPLFI